MRVPFRTGTLQAGFNWLWHHDRRLLVAAMAGALLYTASGWAYSVLAQVCNFGVSAPTAFTSSMLFGLGLALMSVAWLGLARPKGPISRPQHTSANLKTTIGAALALHLMVLIVPPFLSNDPLAYGAIGSLISKSPLPMYAPLGALSPTDAYAQLIVGHTLWLGEGSAYGPLFNWLAAGIVAIAGDNVRLALLLFQFLAGAALFFTAFIAADAAAVWSKSQRPDRAPADVRLQVLRLVLFCPLALIETSSNAHNDSFLALLVAMFSWTVVRRHALAPFLPLALSLGIKLSGALLIMFYALARLALVLPRRVLLAFIGAAALLGLSYLISAGGVPTQLAFGTFGRLIGSPDQVYPFCTRSIECLPRAWFHIGLDAPQLAWIVGLCFRAGGVLLLLFLALRVRRPTDLLPQAAAFLFLYYLFFHGYMQAWYLLSLLPLMFYLNHRLRAAAMAYMISSVSQYGLDFWLGCSTDPVAAAVREGLGLFIVLMPPIYILLFGPHWIGQNHRKDQERRG